MTDSNKWINRQIDNILTDIEIQQRKITSNSAQIQLLRNHLDGRHNDCVEQPKNYGESCLGCAFEWTNPVTGKPPWRSVRVAT